METIQYRNVLAEAGYSPAEIEERTQRSFYEIFYGPDRFCHGAGTDMAYMEDTGNHDVRTEGMSYGMMMCVQMDRKAEFDKLWKWTKTYMYITEGINSGYFAWSVSPEGVPNASGPAPDGEEYFAIQYLYGRALHGPSGQVWPP